MTLPTREKLYGLLPRLYKLRDVDRGEPLRALLSIIETQLDRVEGDISQLYDNWFIETCDEWLVPYIGDLLGVRGQYAFDQATVSLRPFVANTLDYRRRKGTVSVLERLAQDVTGWPGRAVEFFQLLATTQHLNHVREHDLRTPDLRDTSQLELLSGPFERAMHFAEVRRIRGGRGKYNLPNVGIFLWRLGAPLVDDGSAVPVAGAGPGRYTFSQLGRDAPLFNPSRVDLQTGRVAEPDVPGPLRPRALFEEARAAREALSQGKTPAWVYLARERPCLRVSDAVGEIAPELIQFCDLSDWTTLPAPKTFVVPDPPDPAQTKVTRVAVDVRLGRLAVVSGNTPETFLVSYRHGFSAALGGGGYARAEPLEYANLERYPVTAADRTKPMDVALGAAVNQWISDGCPPALIEVLDSATYEVPDLSVPSSTKLVLRAHDGTRPVLKPGAAWQVKLAANASLTLDGFMVGGQPLVITTLAPAPFNADHHLTLRHCTLVPGLTLAADGKPLSPNASTLQIAAGSQGPLRLTVQHTICGRLDLRNAPCTVTITDAILDGCGGVSDTLWKAGESTLENVSVFGTTSARSIEASNVIFGASAVVERTQVGCVRFSFVAPGSQLPRRYMCQPDKAIDGKSLDEQTLILAWLKPSYTSQRYGDPGYAQLGATCPDEIKTGADDAAEMGAFHLLRQPQRLSNLGAALEEYLRFGLEADVFFAT